MRSTVFTTPGRDKFVTGDPEYVKEACAKSLKLLGVEQIDLYYMHRYVPHYASPIHQAMRTN